MGMYRRGATWWLRQRVPAAVGLGDRVVRLSLRTTDRRVASYRAAVVTAHVLGEGVSKADDIARAEERIGRLNDLVAQLFSDDAPIRDQLAAHHELAAAQRQLARLASPQVAEADVAPLPNTAESDLKAPEVWADQMTALQARLDAVAAMLERQAHLPAASNSLRDAVATAMDEQKFKGLDARARRPWTEFVEEYRSQSDIKAGTFQEYRTAFDDLAAITGAIPFVDITPVHVTDALRRRISRARPRNGRTILANDTQQKFITGISSLLTWAANTGLSPKGTNAAEGLRPIGVKRSEESAKKKRAFSPEELRMLYTAPIFVGCESEGRVNTPGTHRHKGNRVWMLLLALLGGWRVGELSVMEVGDVRIEEGVMFLSLTERAIELIEDRETKTEASPRRLVVHPIIREFGFDEFVQHRRRQGLGARLFTQKTPSNQLNRIIRKAGVTDRKVSLHSLRHNFVQLIDESFPAEMEKGFRDKLTGHATNERPVYERDMTVAEARALVRGLIVPPPVAALTGWTGRTSSGRRRIKGG